MIITWENADDFELIRKSFRNKKTGKRGWYLQECCKGCKEPYFSGQKHSTYCSNKCQKEYQKRNGLYKWNAETVKDYVENKIGLILLSTELKSYTSTIKVQCSKCNHVWIPFFNNLIKGQTKCPKCEVKNTPTTWQDAINLFNSYNLELLSNEEEYKSANSSKLKFKCKKCGFEHEMSYTGLKYSKYENNEDCQVCRSLKNNKKIFFADIKQWFEDENWTVLSTEDDYKSQNSTPIHCICPSGHEQWKSVRKWRVGRRCPYCTTSGPKLEVRKFIEGLGYKVSFNNRSILDGKELDFYFPYLNKAIEFNGDYWHCNYNMYPSTYYNAHKGIYANDLWVVDGIKKRMCKKKDIELSTIWENDWKWYTDDAKRNIVEFLNE